MVFAILEQGAGDRGNLAQFRAELSKICPRARSSSLSARSRGPSLEVAGSQAPKMRSRAASLEADGSRALQVRSRGPSLEAAGSQAPQMRSRAPSLEADGSQAPRLLPQRRPSVNSRNDCCQLTTLDAESVCINLKQRHANGEPYTWCNRILLAVNPYGYLPAPNV